MSFYSDTTRPTTSSPTSIDSSSNSPSSRTSSRSTSAQDSDLMRLVQEFQPFNAPHGTKGAMWDAIAIAINKQHGVSIQGLACRLRVTDILEQFERQQYGRLKSKRITALDPDITPILEEQLVNLAKGRVEAQLRSKQKALTIATAEKNRAEKKQADRARQEEIRQKTIMKQRDEKRAAAVVARAREGVVNTATAVAKRRKRKGVKTKEQKNAALNDVLRQSREEYLNQLRVQTAAEAAAEVTGETKTVSGKKSQVKSSSDLDLCLLRAVAKCSPFSAETKQEAHKQWNAVIELVLKYCNLKFTTTVIRDRCEALIKDFEANDCKKSTFSSGVVVADEVRVSLLRVIRKAFNRQSRGTNHRDSTSPQGSQVEKDDSAIEIEDDLADEANEDRESDDLEQWGSLEENRLDEGDQADEQVEESLVEDTQDEEVGEQPEQERGESQDSEKDSSGLVDLSTTAQSHRKRRRSESGASPDADPAVGMDLEELQLDENSLGSNQSEELTSRNHKQHRQSDAEQEKQAEDAGLLVETDVHDQHPPRSESRVHLSTVMELIKAERHERRVEFKAMLDLMTQQNDDHRSEWEREHERRANEQLERQREMTALVALLSKERRDRKSEMLSIFEAMNKDRDDRREEFKAMMALITKMVETRSS